jgi:hypothetical protein
MKKILLLVLVVLLVGCGIKFPSTKYSEIQEEGAEIITMSYVPHRSSSTCGVGMTSGGNMAVTMGSVSFPEVFSVTIRCDKHNKTFTFDSKETFNKVKIGDRVILKYVDEISYYKEIPYSEEVVGQHTKQIICGEKIINRD